MDLPKLKWHTETRKVADLKAWEHNPRRMTETQFADLKESIDKFDLVEIPAIDADNTLLAGHRRIDVLRMDNRNEEVIEVRVPNRKLTPEEFKEYNVRSNKNVGEWDYDVLGNIYTAEELRKFGFTDGELGFLFDDENVEFDIPDTTETSLEQLTFALTPEQLKVVQNMLERAKRRPEYRALNQTTDDNSNGNALYVVAVLFGNRI